MILLIQKHVQLLFFLYTLLVVISLQKSKFNIVEQAHKYQTDTPHSR